MKREQLRRERDLSVDAVTRLVLWRLAPSTPTFIGAWPTKTVGDHPNHKTPDGEADIVVSMARERGGS